MKYSKFNLKKKAYSERKKNAALKKKTHFYFFYYQIHIMQRNAIQHLRQCFITSEKVAWCLGKVLRILLPLNRVF